MWLIKTYYMIEIKYPVILLINLAEKIKAILGFSILTAVSFAEMICEEGLKE